MARAKIKLPESFPFTTEMDVRISDINYGGHMGNDVLFSYIQEARIRFLEAFGFSEMDVCGCGLIMTDAVAVYKGQAFRGDKLRIEIAAEDFNTYGCDLLYRVTETVSGREIARAKTGLAAFDYEKQNIVPAPAEFIRRMRGEG